MDWNRSAVVLGKELVDHFRDRRALFSAAFGVFVGPVAITLMLSQLADDRSEADNIEIPIAGARSAPALVDWLGQQAGITTTEAPDDAEARVREGDLEFALVIDEDFRERFAKGKSAEVKVIFDGSENSVRDKVGRIRWLIGSYASAIGSLRLVARGIAPELARPIDLRDVEVSSAQRRAARILGFLPMMILLAGFAAGMGAASDATAGERERGSLEALLVSPATPGAIVTGKWAAAAVFASLGGFLSLALCTAAVRFIPLQEFGLSFRFDGWQFLLAGLIALPASLFAPALQMLVCSFSKTLKEAQSYLGMLVMLPMAPGMLAVMFNLDDSPWMSVVPFFAQTKQLSGLFSGEFPAGWELATGAAVTLAAVSLCLTVIANLFRSEKMVLSR